MQPTVSTDRVRPLRRTFAALSGLGCLMLGVAGTAQERSMRPSKSEPPPYATQAALGQALFEDRSLSRDRTVACASCHQAASGLADSRPTSRGVGERVGTRNAPSLLAVGAYRSYFWDGRAPNLEEQVRAPMLNSAEMGLKSEADLIQRVLENPRYVESFKALDGRDPTQLTMVDIARAIVSYERTLGQAPTALERFLDGDRSALSPDAQSGLRVFQGKAGCASCHRIEGKDAPLTDNLFHSSSVGLRDLGPRLGILIAKLDRESLAQRIACVEKDADCAALGRFAISLEPQDVGAFRTPSLRAVAQTAPYMHDGSLPTLEQVLDGELYYQGESRGYPVILSDQERQDLLKFLREL